MKTVDRIVPDFARAGASHISFHPEETEHVTHDGLIHESLHGGYRIQTMQRRSIADAVIDKREMVISVGPRDRRRSSFHTRSRMKAARKMIEGRATASRTIRDRGRRG